ncbi:eukaryotic translation initiation factor 2D [Scomber scombrus]
MLWSYPAALPTFRTWPPVLQKLAGGADLMLPGVVVPSSGLPDVKKGDCCGVTLVNNRAPVAVGTAAVSSAEMHSLGMKGRGVYVLHTYMDHLWAFGDKSGPPTLPYADSDGQGLNGEEYEVSEDEECVEDEQSPGEAVIDQVCSGTEELSLMEQEEEKGEKGNEQEEEEDDEKTPQEIMDALLLQCFLHALKSKVKKSELPLLTSTFLRNHMFSCCPSGKQLDIKKSSYKKLSKFLQAMQQQHNLVRVKELTKGVESIVAVDWSNRELRSFAAPEETDVEVAPVQDAREGETLYHPPEITTLYSVSARLESLFLDSKKRKGTILQPTEVRDIVTEYVKKNELVDENNKNYVTINPTLCDCLLEKSEYQEIESLKWDDLFSRTLGRMQECYQIVFPGQAPLTKKGHIEPIDIAVASRGSNKKVTLIKNLEVYGLDPSVVATALQHRVQASSVLHPIPGAKDKVLVQIQGNQIQKVGNLLLDHYQIPRKYIQGLEKAPKSGKKK